MIRKAIINDISHIAENRTLYVSDLDGTLLRSDERISEYSCSVINSLIQQGLHFSYATARSLITAEKVTENLNVSFPVIVYNGAFVIDSLSKEVLLSNYFSDQDVLEIRNMLTAFGIYPIAYAFINGVEKFSYHTGHVNAGIQFFLNSRQNDIRRTPVDHLDELFCGNAFYYSCIGTEAALLPACEYFKTRDNVHCIFQKDIYSHAQWLEILPVKASKANAILQLKQHLNCDKVISFGDALNDISMFQISDECYAVDNAHRELKAIATGIIDGNNQDGVARWLEQNVLLQEGP
jgi:Cof subfamily protein (haloacid dehalogenase superfamily)